jgi:hypothetical protein
MPLAEREIWAYNYTYGTRIAARFSHQANPCDDKNKQYRLRADL